jgi:hypothetical protein
MSLQASPNSVHSQPHTYRGKIGVFLTGGTQNPCGWNTASQEMLFFVSHFPEAANEARFINTGFNDWKHFSEGCGKHEVSRAHAAALGKNNGFKQSHQPGQGNIINQLNNDAIVVQLH